MVNLFLCFLLFQFPTYAVITEPDNVLWGNVVLGSEVVPANQTNIFVEARRSLSSAPLASYRIGANPRAGNLYSLSIPLESGTPLVDPSSAAQNEQLIILVRNGNSVRYLTIYTVAARGTITRLDLGDVDADNNGLVDNWERTNLGASGQDPNADPDQDGVSNRNEMLNGTLPLLADTRHPADSNPTNNVMTIHEVTAYALAWKLNNPWHITPTNIPIDYLTRAGYLWKNGENYKLDTNLVSVGAPLWWTNKTVAAPLAENQSEATVLTRQSTRSESSVVRMLPSSYKPGESVLVTINVTPSSKVSAYAVEESIPEGWTIAQISHEGEFIASEGIIRWGPFFDNQPLSITYLASVNEARSGEVAFDGLASFDGTSLTAGGAAVLISSGWARLQATPQASGFKLSLRGEPGRAYEIEYSTDLRTWQSLTRQTAGADGRLEFLDPAATASKTRFYRTRQP